MKKKESFWALVALGRAVNTLRFVQMPLLEHKDDTSTAGMRAKHNSLLSGSSLFVESFLSLEDVKVALRVLRRARSTRIYLSRREDSAFILCFLVVRSRDNIS
jgi:hypothetical protein